MQGLYHHEDAVIDQQCKKLGAISNLIIWISLSFLCCSCHVNGLSLPAANKFPHEEI